MLICRIRVIIFPKIFTKGAITIKVQAIILDIDGTLWDSTEVVSEAWNKAIEEHTDLSFRTDPQMLKGEFGKPLDEIMKNLFPDLDEQSRYELGVHCYKYENEWCRKGRCTVYDGVVEGIRRLSEKCSVFIVSNCQDGYIESFLEATGLGDCVSDFTCPGYTGRLKGDNIRIIMERNGIAYAVYVGDTEGDRLACEATGVPMIFARYGFGELSKSVYCEIDSFSQLLDIIE